MTYLQEEWHYIRQALLAPALIVVAVFLLIWLANSPVSDAERGALSLLLLWLWLLTAIDVKHYTLPDLLTLSGLVLGLVLAPLVLNIPLWSSVAGALIGGGLFWGISYLFSAIKGYAGMGLGDVKLLAMLGAWVGLTGLPLVLLIASIAAVLWLLVRIPFTNKEKRSPVIPYGPFLALGGAVTALHGPTLWSLLHTLKLEVF